MKLRLLIIAISCAPLAALCLSSCTTLGNVSLKENLDPLKPPQQIEGRSNGKKFVVHSPTVRRDSLLGWWDREKTQPAALAISSIQNARVRRLSGPRTALAVVGAIVAPLGIWFLLIATSGGISY